MHTYNWKGTFEKSGDRRTFKLSFQAESDSAAKTILDEYVSGITAQGWKMVENEVTIK